jgi:lipopolysaccharide transport system permease protein
MVIKDSNDFETRSNNLANNRPLPTSVIEPSHGFANLKLGELYRFRDLFFILISRDLTIRYRQTILGIAWAILQPILSMIIFSFFFGRLAKVPSDGLPYPIFSFSGLVPWTFFATSVSISAN